MSKTITVLCCVVLYTVTGRSYSAPATKPNCPEKVADVIFVFDSSSSIWEDEFSEHLNFVADVVSSFNIGQGNIRVGVVTFGTDVRLDFHLDQYTNSADLITALKNIPYLGGGTSTGDAIRFARKEMFLKQNGGRSWAARILVLVTDGFSQNTTATAIEASIAVNDDIEIFAIGLGRGVDDFELKCIASEPTETHIFKVKSHESFDIIKSQTQKIVCKTSFKEETPNSEIETPKKRCSEKAADVYFVLDGSSSMWLPDFKSQINFVKIVVNTFDLGSNKTRVGIITFSDNVHVHVPLGESSDKTKLKERVDTTPFLTGGTNTGAAIQYLTEKGFGSDVSRPDVAHVVIILTDGQSSDYSDTIRQARRAHKHGIYFFTVGIGLRTNLRELKAIASDPDENFVFTVDDSEGLSAITELLAVRTCSVPKLTFSNDEPVTCTWDQPSDVMFVFDSTSFGRRHSSVIADVIVKVVQKFGDSKSPNRFGILQDNFPETGDIALSEFSKIDVFVKAATSARFHSLQPLLRKLRRYSFQPAFGGRPNAQKIAVVFVDDKLYDSKETVLEAKRTKFKKIKIFVVAIGSNHKKKELEEMCSDPVSQHLLQIESYSYLRQHTDELIDMLCQGSRIDKK